MSKRCEGYRRDEARSPVGGLNCRVEELKVGKYAESESGHAVSQKTRPEKEREKKGSN